MFKLQMFKLRTTAYDGIARNYGRFIVEILPLVSRLHVMTSYRKLGRCDVITPASNKSKVHNKNNPKPPT